MMTPTRKILPRSSTQNILHRSIHFSLLHFFFHCSTHFSLLTHNLFYVGIFLKTIMQPIFHHATHFSSFNTQFLSRITLFSADVTHFHHALPMFYHALAILHHVIINPPTGDTKRRADLFGGRGQASLATCTRRTWHGG